MVHPIHLVQGGEFKINLETDHIILHGSIEESAGVILRGSVILNCHENTKIKSVVLKLVGKIKVNWVEGSGSHQHNYKSEQTILEHEWSFMPHTKKTYHLSEGHYKWDFELPLPGDLPETIEHDLGQVYYRLKAVAERPTFSMNYTDKRSLKVSRVMSPTSLEFIQSMIISNVWADKLGYEISTPTKCYTMGSMVPITFELRPIAPELQVKSISCMLKEYLTLTAITSTTIDDHNQQQQHKHSKTESKIVKLIRDDAFYQHAIEQNGSFKKTLGLNIPEEDSQLLMVDTQNDLIRVKHKIKFTVTLINGDGHISELRAAIPIILATLSVEEDANALPAYEDAWKSVPYDPTTIAQLIASGGLPPSLAIATPNSAASLAATTFSNDDPPTGASTTTSLSPSSSSSINNSLVTEATNHDDPLPWQGLDLSRVPSYTTAIRSTRIYSFSGCLPTYDSLAVPGRVG
ncbi:hypothetical protein BJ944DRAFT_265488 [Cunninghamella echinulata]|nr:hypothetical protein BJ944DRAFT_265488 [Cunninghamella echinulata]